MTVNGTDTAGENPLPTLSESVLFTDATVYSTEDPHATALMIADGVIAWIGPTDTALTLFGADRSISHVRLDGHLVTPSFVDGAPGDSSEASRLERGITDVLEASAPVTRVVPTHDPAYDFLALASSGLPYVFGSGGEETSPWEWVRAASHGSDSSTRMSDRAAFLASTRAPRRAAGNDHPGALNPGAPADLVVWEPWPLIVHGNDERIQTWSTDPRSRTPVLPDLADARTPRAVAVFVQGRLRHALNEFPAPVA